MIRSLYIKSTSLYCISNGYSRSNLSMEHVAQCIFKFNEACGFQQSRVQQLEHRSEQHVFPSVDATGGILHRTSQQRFIKNIENIVFSSIYNFKNYFAQHSLYIHENQLSICLKMNRKAQINQLELGLGRGYMMQAFPIHTYPWICWDVDYYVLISDKIYLWKATQIQL